MQTWRWIKIGSKWNIKRVYSDDFIRKGDFDLPSSILKPEIDIIEKFGPGLLSWIYIQWLKYKLR